MINDQRSICIAPLSQRLRHALLCQREGVAEFVGIRPAGLGFVGLAAAAAADDADHLLDQISCMHLLGQIIGDDGAEADTARNESSDEPTRTPRPTRTPEPAKPNLPEDPCTLISSDEPARFSTRMGEGERPRGGDPEVWRACRWDFEGGSDWDILTVEVRRFYSGETAESVTARLRESLNARNAEEVEGVGQFAVFRDSNGDNLEADAVVDGRVISLSWTNRDASNAKDAFMAVFRALPGRID